MYTQFPEEIILGNQKLFAEQFKGKGSRRGKSSGIITENDWKELCAHNRNFANTTDGQRLGVTSQMSMGLLAFGDRGYFGHSRLEHSIDTAIKSYMFARIMGYEHKPSMQASAGGTRHDIGHIALSHGVEQILESIGAFDRHGFQFVHDDLTIILAHTDENRALVESIGHDFRHSIATLIADEYVSDGGQRWSRVKKLHQYLIENGFPIKDLAIDLHKQEDLDFAARSDIRMISRIFHDDGDTASYLHLDFLNSVNPDLNIDGIINNSKKLIRSTTRTTLGGKEFIEYQDAEALRGYWIRFSRLYTDITYSAPLRIASELAAPALKQFLEKNGEEFPLADLAMGKKLNAEGAHYGCKDLLKDIGLFDSSLFQEQTLTQLYPNYIVVTWPQGLGTASNTELNRLMKTFDCSPQPLELPETIVSLRPKFNRGREFVADSDFLRKKYTRSEEADGHYALNRPESIKDDSFRVTAFQFGPVNGSGKDRFYVSNRLLKRVLIGVRQDVDIRKVQEAVRNQVSFGRIKVVDANGAPIVIS